MDIGYIRIELTAGDGGGERRYGFLKEQGVRFIMSKLA